MRNCNTKAENILGLVLAAGFSRRFGEEDKRRFVLPNGETLLRQTCTRVMEWLGNVSVVVRPEDDPNLLGIPKEAHILIAPDASHGIGSSITNAIVNILENKEFNRYYSIAIMLADLPNWEPSTCRELLTYSQKNNIIRPKYQIQDGHPVIIGRDFWSDLAGLSGDTGAKYIIKKNAKHVISVQVDHEGICKDLDFQKS